LLSGLSDDILSVTGGFRDFQWSGTGSMTGQLIIFLILQLLIILFALSLGRSILLLKIRREENRKRELELAVFETKAEILSRGKKIARELEDALYTAKVLQEIDTIIRKNNPQ
jgi:hypothetical protein